MIDRQWLGDLLPLLKQHGVSSIKMQGLELSFHVEPESQTTAGQGPTDSTEVIASALKKQEEAMPPDLRADSLMDQDKVLNWSSPDQPGEQPELPLTGEGPL